MTTATAVTLKRLFDGETISLAACDGSRLISQAYDVFGIICSDFEKQANEPGEDTPPMPMAVYELVEDATLEQIFGSLADNVESLCLTQSQIIAFCKNHRDKLVEGRSGNLFLYNDAGKLFVADAEINDQWLNVYRFHLSGQWRWYGRYTPRVAVPQV